MHAGDNVMRFGPDALVPRHDFATTAHLAGLVSADDLAGWLAEGAVFAVESHGIQFFPTYAFSAPPLRPLPAVRQIFSALKMAPWETAEWFCCGCGALAWRRPQDVLHADPSAVLAATSV